MTVLGGGAVSYERGTPVARVKCVSRMYGVARERDTCERRMKSKTSAIDKYMVFILRKVDVRLPGPPNHHDDKVDSDQ